MATIYDVAKLAGVSPATVSRVFNGVGVSPAKVEAVRAAAAQLSFTPSRTARSLRTQSTDVIALVIPDVSNPYFTEVARGVEDVAQAAGFSVVLCNSDADDAKEQTYLGIAVAERMAGVIIAAATPHTDVSPVIAASHAVVAVDRAVSADVDTVVMANRDAGYAATMNLIDAGFERIACVTGPAVVETATERARGWRDALSDRSLPVPEGFLVHSSFDVAGGRRAWDTLAGAPAPPEAVVAGNNLLGVGVIQRLSETRQSPPAVGVSVVGSLPFTTLAPSAVTVVRLPADRMGETAARMLLERIAGADEAPRRIALPGELLPADFSAR